MLLLITVFSSSATSGFSLRYHPTDSSSPSSGLQVWFDGTPQLTITYPIFYEFPVAARTSTGRWITDLHWDFGDGSTLDVPFSTESYVSDVRYHAYSQPGQYTVSVTAYDNMGNSGSAQVTVNWASGPGTVRPMSLTVAAFAYWRNSKILASLLRFELRSLYRIGSGRNTVK